MVSLVSKPDDTGEILERVSASDYHADILPPGIGAAAVPTFNVSTAKRLLQQSPRHAREYHPRLGGRESEVGNAAQVGTILHNLILEHGDQLEAVDADDWRTKLAQQERCRITQAGKIAVLRPKLAPFQVIAGVFMRRLEQLGVNFAGQSEVTIRWRDNGVICRGRLDRLQVDGNSATIFDLKTTSQSCHPDDFARTIVDRGYHVQAVAYRRAVEAVYPHLAGRVRFVFLVLEVEPPYDVLVCELSPEFTELGEAQWDRALSTWGECLESGHFPGYTPQGHHVVIHPPTYALKRESEMSYGA